MEVVIFFFFFKRARINLMGVNNVITETSFSRIVPPSSNGQSILSLTAASIKAEGLIHVLSLLTVLMTSFGDVRQTDCAPARAAKTGQRT